MPAAPTIRFVDILTTAAAVANYLGSGSIEPAHLIDAIAILRDGMPITDLGRAVSPLVPRAPGGPTVGPAARELVQRWYTDLGGHVEATLHAADVDRLLADLSALPPP